MNRFLILGFLTVSFALAGCVSGAPARHARTVYVVAPAPLLWPDASPRRYAYWTPPPRHSGHFPQSRRRR